MCDFALPDEFTEEQKIALIAASEFVFDISWAKEKIRKGEYELWDDVNDYKTLGRTVAENLELPTGLLPILILKNSVMTLPLKSRSDDFVRLVCFQIKM